MVVVDGRQPGYSRGVDLYELADMMKEFGCYEAMNLDGGGSSTMVIRNSIVNRPSDAEGPRPVANALLILDTSQNQ
jgi:exopolysaccharide biosynthesis protein